MPCAGEWQEDAGLLRASWSIWWAILRCKKLDLLIWEGSSSVLKCKKVLFIAATFFSLCIVYASQCIRICSTMVDDASPFGAIINFWTLSRDSFSSNQFGKFFSIEPFFPCASVKCYNIWNVPTLECWIFSAPGCAGTHCLSVWLHAVHLLNWPLSSLFRFSTEINR